MKEKKNLIIWISALFFSLLFLFNMDGSAAEFNPEFQLISNNNKEYTVTEIDKEKHFYKAIAPDDFDVVHDYITKIQGKLPDKNWNVNLKLYGYQVTTKPNEPVENTSATEGTFLFELVSSCLRTSGVYELEMTNGNETVSYYICLDGNPCWETGANLNQSSGYEGAYSNQVDLVDTSNESHSVIKNIINENEDSGSTPTNKQYQEIVLTDKENVAIRITNDVEIPKVCDSQGSRKATYLTSDECYYRINGGEWIRFNHSFTEKDYVSPNLELNQGKNIVEIQQRYTLVYHHMAETDGTKQYWMMTNDYLYSNRDPLRNISYRTQVLLIDNQTGSITKSSKNSNTDLVDLTAVSFACNNNDAILQYNTEVNEETDVFKVVVNKNRKYDPIVVGVDTVNPGATWKIVDDEGKNISFGRVGKYAAFDAKDMTSFKIQVTSADGTQTEKKTVVIEESALSSEAFLEGVEFRSNAISLAGNEEITRDKLTYTLNHKRFSLSMYITVSPNATFTVDGCNRYNQATGEININAKKQGITRVKITSEDGYTTRTYHFLNCLKGKYNYFGISDGTRKLASSMLDGYLNQRSDEAKKNMTSGYWSVFMGKATDISFENSYVYDVTTHEFNQATDYGGVILELCMIGENPYDFNGRNYVQELNDLNVNGLFGGYANNIWAYMAFKAAGYDYEYMDRLVTIVKEQANRRTSGSDWSLDMSAWAMAVIKDEFTLEEQADWAEWIYESCQSKEGDEAGIFQDVYYRIPNSNTHGCVLTALNELNIDPENFAVTKSEEETIKTITPIQALKDLYMTENGQFKYNLENTWGIGYNKDVIVALGDLVKGTNVWNRTMITQDDLNTLLSTVESLLTSGTEEQQKKLNDAYNVAKEIEDITKNGKAYYDLLGAAKVIKKDLVPSVRMCSIDTGKTIDKLIEDINGIGEVTQENALSVMELQKAYDTLENDIVKGYVTNYDVLSEAVANAQELIKQNTIDLITQLPDTITLNDEVTVNEAKKAYDALTDEMKQNIPQELVTKLTNALKVIESLKKGTDQATSTVPTNSTQATSNETNETKVALNLKSTSSANKVKLSWSPVEGANGYEIFRYNTKTKKYKSIALVSSKKSSYIISRLNGKKGSKLQPATKYTFKVSAYTNSDGKKVYTLAEVLKTATCPSKVTKVKVKKSLTKATVTWSRVKGSTGYQVWGKTSKAGKYKLLKTVKGSKTVRCTVKGLQKNKNYYIKVRAYKTVGSKNVYGTCSAVVKTK